MNRAWHGKPWIDTQYRNGPFLTISLRLNTETEHQSHVLGAESILDGGEGRCVGSEKNIDSGKEQNGCYSGPSKEDGKMGRFLETGTYTYLL